MSDSVAERKYLYSSGPLIFREGSPNIQAMVYARTVDDPEAIALAKKFALSERMLTTLGYLVNLYEIGASPLEAVMMARAIIFEASLPEGPK